MWVYSPPARVGRRGRLRHAVPHPGRHDRRLPQWRADAEIRTAPLLNFTIGIDGETVGVEGQGPGAIGSFIALTQTIAKAFGWGDTGSPIEDVEIFNEPAGTGSGLGGPEPDRCRTRRSRAGEALADLHEASGPGPCRLPGGWDHLIATRMGPPWRVIEDAGRGGLGQVGRGCVGGRTVLR